MPGNAGPFCHRASGIVMGMEFAIFHFNDNAPPFLIVKRVIVAISDRQTDAVR